MALTKDEMKQAMKEGLKEWLDERYTEFGRWTFGMLFVAIIGALAYFVLSINGWHK